MSFLLNFEFVAILNLFVLLLWPVSSSGPGPGTNENRRSAIGIIMLVLTIIAVVVDIVFLVLKATHGT